MEKTKDGKVRLPLFSYVSYLLVASFLLTGVTFSGYITTIRGEDTSRVASFEISESGVSEKMIDFGYDEDGEHKEANLFFTLSSANPDEHTDNIMQLSNVFVNDDLLDALQAARTPEDILAAAADHPCEE